MEQNTPIFNDAAELHVMLEKLWVEINSAGIWGNLGTILIFKASFMTTVFHSFFLDDVYFFYLFNIFLGYIYSSTYSHYLSILFFKNIISFLIFPIIFSLFHLFMLLR